MAARRLLIVMLVLLGVSSAIAVVIPEPDRRDSGSGETAATGSTGATGATGSDGSEETKPDPVAEETVSLDRRGKAVELGARPDTRMVLTVKAKEGATVEIGGLELTGFADQYAPAVFDLYLPDEPGRYPIGVPGEEPAAIIVTS